MYGMADIKEQNPITANKDYFFVTWMTLISKPVFLARDSRTLLDGLCEISKAVFNAVSWVGLIVVLGPRWRFPLLVFTLMFDGEIVLPPSNLSGLRCPKSFEKSWLDKLVSTPNVDNPNSPESGRDASSTLLEFIQSKSGFEWSEFSSLISFLNIASLALASLSWPITSQQDTSCCVCFDTVTIQNSLSQRLIFFQYLVVDSVIIYVWELWARTTLSYLFFHQVTNNDNQCHEILESNTFIKITYSAMTVCTF